MELYKKLYATLFAKVDEALTELDKAFALERSYDILAAYRARDILEKALQEAEETYIAEAKDTDPAASEATR